MRERGVQSRKARTQRLDGDVRRAGPPSASRGGNPWQLIAIIAIIAATAGWTTAAILGSTLASRPETAAVESPDESFDAGASDDTEVPPAEETHDAPELEALLPRALNGTALSVQSWTGDAILLDNDTWSNTIRDFLTKSGKAPTDLRGATADDPNQVLQDSVGVYEVVGVPGTGLRDALVAAWRVDYPDLKVTQVTLGGKTVTKLDFADDTVDSYMYLRDDVVFDIETTTDAAATAALDSLPQPGASGSPGASRAPTGSGSPAPASKAPVSSPSPS